MAKSRRKEKRAKLREQNRARPISTERPLLIERLADAALIVALFTILAFSEIRFEGFETEKTALIPIFGGIILASHLTRLFKNRDIPWKQYLLNPLVIGVIGIIVTSSVATILGFSPIRSWFGEAERLSGLQTLLIYFLIFSQAVVAAERLTPLLTPIIITISAPLCLSVLWAQFIQGLFRPGSTTGNPNYLSSWLVMSMLMLVVLLFIRIRKATGEWNWILLPQLLFAPLLLPIPVICLTIYQRVKDVRYGWTWKDWAYLLLILLMLVLMTFTILAVGSRAALLSYAVGGVTSVGIMLVLARQRQLLIMFSGAVIILGVAYVTASNLAPRELKSAVRILSLGDSRRQELWGGAVSVLSQQSEPFYLADGTPDSLASLRPVIGYGLSVIPQTQGRFGATTHKNQFVGSYHNHIFDYIVMTGYPGMLAYVLMYLGAIAMTLQQLLLIRGDLFRWLMVLTMFGLLGTLVTPSLFPGADFLNVVPIGVSLGVLAGNFVWIAGQAYRKSDYEKDKTGLNVDIAPTLTAHISDRQILLAGLLGVIILRWVDIQFAFVQAASEPMFWALAGLFLGHYYKLKFATNENEDADVIHDARPIDWQVAVFATGIMIFYGFGVTVSSSIYNHKIGIERIPFFMGLLVLVGYAGSYLMINVQHRVNWVIASITPAVWFVMWFIKSTIANGAGNTFDNTLAIQSVPESGVFSTFFQLSLTGVVMVVFMLVLWTLYDNWRVKIQYPIGILGAVVLGLVGVAFYTSNYTSATAHAVGIGFMEEGARSQDEQAFLISDSAFRVGTNLDNSNARMQIHYLGMLTQQKAILPDSNPTFTEEIESRTETLLQNEPYFIHTLEWGQFSGFHERVFGKPFREIQDPQQ